MVAKAYSAVLFGIEAIPVDVEAQIFGATRRFTIVGLPDSALRESKERVRCAIENSGFTFPNREVVVSLGPASLPKAGAGFDLAIALSVLAADGQIESQALAKKLILGELALDGRIKRVSGVLAASLLARSLKGFELLVPQENTVEGALVREVSVFAIASLSQGVGYLKRVFELPPVARGVPLESGGGGASFADVIGQESGKRVMEIAAAGGHNVLLSGPPGAGKSMLASRLPSILPPLREEEAIDLSRIYAARSDHANFGATIITKRPFRSPHHTTSTAGLVGGGTVPQPGEITLAHHGVLFLDELPEFRRDSLEALRQPLETQRVTISRASLRLSFPADFILVAAMNPCPCGYYNGGATPCRCFPQAVQRYHQRLSGPLLDRIDLHLTLPALSPTELLGGKSEDSTGSMRERAAGARKAQLLRPTLNARLGPKEVRRYCELEPSANELLHRAIERLKLTARSYHRLLKVARTIADLDGATEIAQPHLAEALSYRATALK